MNLSRQTCALVAHLRSLTEKNEVARIPLDPERERECVSEKEGLRDVPSRLPGSFVPAEILRG